MLRCCASTEPKTSNEQIAKAAIRRNFIALLLKSQNESQGYLQTPHFPPSLAQCLQYLQFLQAWQGSAPVQVAAEVPNGIWLRRRIHNMI